MFSTNVNLITDNLSLEVFFDSYSSCEVISSS